jgi:hypothetical protein
MTANTLGNLFPQLGNCRPEKNSGPSKPRKGTAQTLKHLYPEIESWDPFYVTSAWLYWGKTCGIELDEPRARDERFPDFLVNFIHTKMLEVQASIKPSKKNVGAINSAFQMLEESTRPSTSHEYAVGGSEEEDCK